MLNQTGGSLQSGIQTGTVCPGSSDQFYIVGYYIKCGLSSWTYSNIDSLGTVETRVCCTNSLENITENSLTILFLSKRFLTFYKKSRAYVYERCIDPKLFNHISLNLVAFNISVEECDTKYEEVCKTHHQTVAGEPDCVTDYKEECTNRPEQKCHKVNLMLI